MTTENISTKHCKICKELKSLTEFHKDKNKKDGVNATCKPCACIISKEWRIKNEARSKEQRLQFREKNRTRLALVEKERRKDNPELLAKSIAYFRKWNLENPEKAKELRAISEKNYFLRHPGRRKEIHKRYVAKNKEKVDISRANYRKNNREVYNNSARRYRLAYPENVKAFGANRKARRLGSEGLLIGHQIKKMYIAQEQKCNLCKIDISQYYEVDHIIPFSRNGLNVISNIQLTCKSCNSKKRSKLNYIHQ